MNKKLLTVAIGAALAAPAFMAQAEVKVYGRLQVEEGRVSVETTSPATTYVGVAANTDRFVLNDTGLGRIGIAADEDLSGGWKAIGLIEMQIDTADGNTIDANGSGTGTATTGVQAQMFAAREIFVGVSHKDIGTLKFGRHNSPYLNAGISLDPFITTMLEARGNLGMSSNKDGVLNGHNSFLSDGVVYNSATWGGFGFQLYYGLDQSGTEAATAVAPGTQTAGDVSVNVGWAGGPAKVFASFNRQDVVKTAAQDRGEAFQVGGQLTFGGTSIRLLYEDADNGITSTTAIPNRKWIMAGVGQKIGPVEIAGQISRFTTDGAATTEQEGQYYAVGAIFSLSKTARVFGGYRVTAAKLSANDAVVRDERVSTIGLRKDF